MLSRAGVRIWSLTQGEYADGGDVVIASPVHARSAVARAEGIRSGADHVRQLTVIGDGAAWIWNIGQQTRRQDLVQIPQPDTSRLNSPSR